VTDATLVLHATGARLAPRITFDQAAEPANRLAVYRYLVHLTRNPDLAEDLTQAAFERALTSLDRFDPARGPLRFWLVMIARRVAVDHMRSERSRRAREERYAAAEPDHAPPPDLPGEVSPEMRRALGSLSDTEREAVALRVIIGLSGTEAAAVMGISPTACSTTLHRALTRLRRDIGAADHA